MKTKPSPTIALSETLALPLEAVTQTFGILAIRGVGKTYTASVLAEGLLEAGQRVIVSDPVGVWWGLRIAADGKLPGLPILILGGDHADVPLTSGQGQVVAELVVAENLSVVLDLSHFRKAETTRFMTDFCETLYHQNRQPAHLILDEADVLAPQRPLPGQQRLLGAVEDLVRRGRARGLGTTLITQRPAVLNKDVLTQVEALITLRLIAPQDRAAIEAWIRVHGTPEQREELMRSLPSLPIGTAWFWSPGWLQVFQQVAIRKRRTFDSSATPKVGQKVRLPSAIASVDVAALSARLAARLQAAAETETPTAPMRRRSMNRASQEPVAECVIRVVERVEVPVVSPEALARLETLIGQWIATGQELLAAAQTMQSALARVSPPPASETAMPQATSPARPAKPARQEALPAKRAVQPQRPPEARKQEPLALTPTVADPLSQPQQRILDALAQFAALGLETVARSNVAVFSAQSPRSSGFANNLSRLNTRGLLCYSGNGSVALTEAGQAVATGPGTLRSLQDLHDAWCARLSGPQGRMFQHLVAHYPSPIERTTLAQASDQSPHSSGYANNLSALRSLKLLDYPQAGYVVATPLLFPPGLERNGGNRSRRKVGMQ